MIETECFQQLNVFGPNNTLPPDLDPHTDFEEETTGCFFFRKKVFKIQFSKKKQNKTVCEIYPCQGWPQFSTIFKVIRCESLLKRNLRSKSINGGDICN